MITTAPARPGSSSAAVQRHHNEGHGRRLTAAFEALEAFPALAESRNRLLRLVSAERVSPADVVAPVESDIALVISVLRLANQLDERRRGRARVASLLHDIGKLVLTHAYPGYPGQVHGEARTPEERVHRERRELGVDHALVGGVLARRWGLPKAVASVIERHHADDCDGEAAFVRLADMLAHYAQGGAVSPTELLKCARTVGLGPPELRSVMYDMPYPVGQRP